jgi:hypothetical protein
MAVSSGNLPLSKTKPEMESNVEMKKIRQDLDMLVMLYQRLVDRMIPVEDAAPEEKAAIESKDEVFCRSDLDKALE